MPVISQTSSLNSILEIVCAKIAPLWPLQDYVAVNPFLGFAEHDFLSTEKEQASVRDAQMLMPLSYFHTLLERGIITREDLVQALREAAEAYPHLYLHIDVNDVERELEKKIHSPKKTEFASHRMRTVAETVDRMRNKNWSSTITNEISRLCSAHYDQGQALWSSPWQGLPLYEAWREIAIVDRRMEKLGAKGFRTFVSEMPHSASKCILLILKELKIPEAYWKQFLFCQLCSISGWASFIKYRCQESPPSKSGENDLIGLLAVRLAYDAGLLEAIGWDPEEYLVNGIPSQVVQQSREEQVGMDEIALRYALQVAAEIGYRRKLCTSIAKAPERKVSRKDAQLVFCIDVRSEVLRRHLESVTDRVETLGFAGFFGLPIEVIPFGATNGPSQCPVLLKPSFRIQEALRGVDKAANEASTQKRITTRLGRQIGKFFRTSATSCFSFVESLGFIYIAKLFADTFALSRPSDYGKFDGIANEHRHQLTPAIEAHGHLGIEKDKRVELAHGILRNLGLTDNFARLVVFCGHGSETTNNPYKAGLDCGACGGHSGESNARVAAALLNDTDVRKQLVQRGINVPADVWFLPAVHNTTTDEFKFFDTDEVPLSHVDELEQLKRWTAQAGHLTRVERSARMGSSSEVGILKRPRDWSEVRPEWGLAGNAAFIVAPRDRTIKARLDGRSFLHNYNYHADKDLRTLELIMTAPMIVTNWINLQYYASTVDNRAFGSGNKLLHNVVGTLGILEGNGGDLMTGLPWQSVHDGQRFQHEPLRLLVVIEAPRAAIQSILDKHPQVAYLACNGWLTLLSIDGENFYRYTALGTWVEEPQERTNSNRSRVHMTDGDSFVDNAACTDGLPELNEIDDTAKMCGSVET